ncbi:hypothetical protein BO86DRAFT_403597 [Aspergillus japonicus CBS 114.51]|uniref:Cytochrome P450 n=1 Tax=Aspergillus japonicus CBS 114.51 TaxID=1448312 RepID=A0A8T8WP61_ASPJA|nr:hypothetical protein BO86DRAFT_403597 [Aspergillus japonicus CBS 114.51]RAH77597.1 hypothetical protein BO86DRAFT_403597 [Aspergillus japonicus CBS 114.51]
MSNHFVLRNPNAFLRPLEFWPERWETNPELERYLVPFSKGSQACLGPDMAHCWLNLVLATVRRFRWSCTKHPKTIWQRRWVRRAHEHMNPGPVD